MNPFQDIFDMQKAYFNTNATKSYEWRAYQLDQLAKMLTENEQRFQRAVCKDFKTATQEYVFETKAPAALALETKTQLKGWMRPKPGVLPKALAASGHTAEIYREPYGVTLIIGPFNGPLTLLFDPAINAIAAGNPCILKTSEELTETTSVLMELVPKYFDPRSVAVVTGSRDEVTELLTLPFDFIFFTGSVKVGKIVMTAAAKNLTPVLLELGGQNPAIVDETANIPDAARKITWGATAWGGQWCTSPGYAYVHDLVADQFKDECVKAIVEFYGEHPRNNPDYSKIISAKAVTRLARLLDPAKLVHGGQSAPEERYIDPTILYPVTWDDPIMEDEIFGPILPILTYRALDDAISEIKKHPKPLGGYIFSRNQANIDDFLSSVSFGGGMVNQVNVQVFTGGLPFGGVGNSGIGHYYSEYGFEALTHAKTVITSPPDVAIEHLFPPYTPAKVQAISQWFEY